jgi:hypothetical protein
VPFPKWACGIQDQDRSGLPALPAPGSARGRLPAREARHKQI